MDTRLPQPAGCGDKYDVSGRCRKRLLSTFCKFFKYPSPEAYASPSPSWGEGSGLHRPGCDKILGTDCASRPRMTGGRGANYFGRSMIEMLGVLAIIAVLSVGGIAGYSKAMEMYKINKTLEHYNYLVLGMLDYVRETKNLAEQTNTGMTMIAEAAGLIPATWQKENNFNLRDDMENIVQIFANKTHLSIDYIFQNSEKHSITDKLCNNLFNNTLKPLSNSIQVIYVTIANKINFAIYYGNTTCDAAKSKKCLRDVELSDIRDSCNFCAEQKFCSIAVKF